MLQQYCNENDDNNNNNTCPAMCPPSDNNCQICQPLSPHLSSLPYYTIPYHVISNYKDMKMHFSGRVQSVRLTRSGKLGQDCD